LIFQVKSLVQNRFLFFSIFVFLLVGCHNNSHLRTQRILKPDEKSISISKITNLGGGEYSNHDYMFRQVGVLGERVELSYLKSNGQSEYGPYVGAGFDFGGFDEQSLGALVGYDYRSYLNQNSDLPLKFGGQIEINAVDSDVGLNLAAHMRPSLTTASKENAFFYVGAHGILVYGRLTERIQWTLNGIHQDEYVPYTVSSLGVGATLGLEKIFSSDALKTTFNQFQIDISFVKNSFKTNFKAPGGARSFSSEHHDENIFKPWSGGLTPYPVFERESGGLLLVTASIGASFFYSNIKKAKNTNPAPTPWPNYNTEPEYFDPKTGLPVKPDTDKLFNPETGEPNGPK